jgi:hypothetical protein
MAAVRRRACLQGTNVRHRAKEIADLVNDPDRVRQEREKVRRMPFGGSLPQPAHPGRCLPRPRGRVGEPGRLDAARPWPRRLKRAPPLIYEQTNAPHKKMNKPK